jgi:hypothetical protein
MAYVKQSWSDEAAGGTPLSAARLNYIEAGIEAAHDLIPAPTVGELVAGSTLTVLKNGDGTWPDRPTDRADIIVAWKGPDPSPDIVSSGTLGMHDNIDYRLVTP